MVTDTKAGTDFSVFKTFQVVHFAPQEGEETINLVVDKIMTEFPIGSVTQ